MIKLVGLDIETTGLDFSAGHKIIEICIGAYRYDPSTRVLTQVGNFFTRRCNPKRDIDPKAYAVHKISLADLLDKPEWAEIAPKVSVFLEWADIGIAHNAQFDFPFVAWELVQAGREIPNIEIFDTMEHGKTATPLGTAPSLQVLAGICDVEYDTTNAHAADYDVAVMMKCVEHGLKWGMFQLPEIEEAQDDDQAAA